jgi:hypothetical protein
MSRRAADNRVVDLLRYRQQNTQRRLAVEAESRAAPRPVLAPVTPFRSLTGREVDHRQAMLRHLTSSR